MWAFVAFLVVLLCVQVAIARVDPPAGLLTWSSDLLTDQGFQTKAAQLWTKFGHWSVPRNMDFRPAAPVYTVIMGVVFRLFGPGVSTLAFYALGVNAATLLVAHAIARRIFSPWAAAAVAASFGVCFTYFAFSRLALIEPTAILFALLAVLVYARTPSVASLCVSVGLAAASFMTKVHFISIVLGLCVAWLIEIASCWRTEQRRALRYAIALGVMVLLTAGVAALYVFVFSQQIADFRATVSQSIAGKFDFGRFLVPFEVIGPEMAYGTRLPTMMILVAACGLVLFWRLGSGGRGAVAAPPRAVIALGLWGVFGVALISSLNYRPSRYMLFLDFPLIALGSYGAMCLVPRRRGAGLAVALLAMLAWQAPLYGRWVFRHHEFSKGEAYGAVVRRVERGSGGAMIALVGQEAAEMGLRSRRIMPLEIDFVPTARYSLCQRLTYWRPRFYVRLQNDARVEDEALAACPQIESKAEVARYRVLGDYKGDLVLYRLTFRPSLSPRPGLPPRAAEGGTDEPR